MPRRRRGLIRNSRRSAATKDLAVSALSVFVSFLLPTAAQAAPSYILQLARIDGGSTGKGYAKWLDVESCDFDISAESTPCNGSGAPQFPNFSFTQCIHSARTKIFELLVTGSSVASAVLDVVGLGIEIPSKLSSFAVRDLRCDSFQRIGAEPGLPLECEAFSFATIGLQTFEKDSQETGKPVTRVTWDLKLAAPASPTPLPASALLLTGLLSLFGTARVARAVGANSCATEATRRAPRCCDPARPAGIHPLRKAALRSAHPREPPLAARDPVRAALIVRSGKNSDTMTHRRWLCMVPVAARSHQLPSRPGKSFRA